MYPARQTAASQIAIATDKFNRYIHVLSFTGPILIHSVFYCRRFGIKDKRKSCKKHLVVK